MSSPDSDPSQSPPYLHIADVLRGEIQDGRYPVGARIPSQAELEERFAVSRPTVQRALNHLRGDGYIDNQRGRPAQVLDWQAAVTRDDPQPSFAALASHVEAAFEERNVSIDTFSLTTESLGTALSAAVNRVLQGELTPESVRVRILLPSDDALSVIPRLVRPKGEGDDWPRRRLRELIRGQVVSLRSTFNALGDIRPDVGQSVEFRSVSLTPTQKIYVLNGRTALEAHYRVVERRVSYGSEEDAIYDVLGLNAVLFPYRADPGDPQSFGSRKVEEIRASFESLWFTVAEPLHLYE